MKYKGEIGKTGTESWIQYIHYIPYLLEIQLCISSKSEPRGKDKIPIKSICLNKKNSFLLGFNHNNNCNHLFAVLFYWFGRETDRQTDIDLLSTHFCIHWLILLCALTGDRTCSFGASGWCSNQRSCPTRAKGNHLWCTFDVPDYVKCVKYKS